MWRKYRRMVVRGHGCESVALRILSKEVSGGKQWNGVRKTYVARLLARILP